MNKNIHFLMSFGERYSVASKFFTEPEIRVVKSLASKAVIGAIPLFPATIFSQDSATVLPTGVNNPSPVTTTRRFDKLKSPSVIASVSINENAA